MGDLGDLSREFTEPQKMAETFRFLLRWEKAETFRCAGFPPKKIDQIVV